MKEAPPISLLGAVVRDYFSDYLPRLRGSSPHTVLSYRDSIVLLLRFVAEQRRKPAAELDLADLDPPGILAFLSHLEDHRNNGVSTRNVRLAAIHAFFRSVAFRNPEQLHLAQKVIAVPFKRAPNRAIDFLEYDEIDSILSAINRTTPLGLYSRLRSRLPGGRTRRKRTQAIGFDLAVISLRMGAPFAPFPGQQPCAGEAFPGRVLDQPHHPKCFDLHDPGASAP